jgi:hypothetical protein
MKTLKKVPIQLVEIGWDEFIPNEIEEGKLYYSERYKVAVHKCLCGCGVKAPINIEPDGWTLTKNEEGEVTVTPSLFHRFECKSHYIITNGIANFV